MSAELQVNKIKSTLQNHPNIKIVAAVKYFDIEKTKELVEAGITHIGENRKDALKIEFFKPSISLIGGFFLRYFFSLAFCKAFTQR